MPSPMMQTLKTRVSDGLKQNFEALAELRGITASDMMRVLVEDFVTRHIGQFSDRVMVSFHRPDDWDHGVWKARARLQVPEEIDHIGGQVLFELPLLDRRLFREDKADGKGMVSPRPADDGRNHLVLMGMLVAGEWRGIVQTNGVAEEDNPTSLQDVRDALRRSIEATLDRLPPRPVDPELRVAVGAVRRKKS